MTSTTGWPKATASESLPSPTDLRSPTESSRCSVSAEVRRAVQSLLAKLPPQSSELTDCATKIDRLWPRASSIVLVSQRLQSAQF